MIKLLKLYIVDYLKKLFLTFMLSIIAGITLFYPLAENITEQILFTNWVLYIAMYGVFFYHFPLSNIVKWSVNLPLQKRDLIIFNFVYQFMKIIATIGCIIFAFWAEYQLFRDNLYVGQLNDNVQILKDSFISNSSVAVPRGFLSAMKLMIVILSISFFFTFIFNVAPYGPFKNKLITFRDTINYIKFRAKTLNHKDLWILLALVLAIGLIPSVYSKAFIAGTFVCSMLSILYLTYEKALVFSKKTRFYCITFSIFIGLYTWLGLLNYSKKVLNRTDLTLMDKIEEWEFQGIEHFGQNPVKQLSIYLSEPNLCDRDIKKLFFYFRKKHNIAVKEVFQYPKSFDKIILSKGPCGLKSISKTIDPKMMTPKMFIEYFKKWEESSLNYSPQKFSQITKPFLGKKFHQTEVIELIKSKNPLAQFYVLQIIKDNPSVMSPSELTSFRSFFEEGGLYALKSFVKGQYCQSYNISELKKSEISFQNNCRKTRQLSSILEEPLL